MDNKNSPLPGGEPTGKLPELAGNSNSYFMVAGGEEESQVETKKGESEGTKPTSIWPDDPVWQSLNATLKALLADLETRPPRQEGMAFCKTCHRYRWCIAYYCQECNERWEEETFGQRLGGYCD